MLLPGPVQGSWQDLLKYCIHSTKHYQYLFYICHKHITLCSTTWWTSSCSQSRPRPPCPYHSQIHLHHQGEHHCHHQDLISVPSSQILLKESLWRISLRQLLCQWMCPSTDQGTCQRGWRPPPPWGTAPGRKRGRSGSSGCKRLQVSKSARKRIMKIQNFSSWLIYRQREKEKVTMMMKNKVTMVKGVCDATGGSKELIFPPRICHILCF